jgi:hypothetical protein
LNPKLHSIFQSGSLWSPGQIVQEYLGVDLRRGNLAKRPAGRPPEIGAHLRLAPTDNPVVTAATQGSPERLVHVEQLGLLAVAQLIDIIDSIDMAENAPLDLVVLLQFDASEQGRLRLVNFLAKPSQELTIFVQGDNLGTAALNVSGACRKQAGDQQEWKSAVNHV